MTPWQTRCDILPCGPTIQAVRDSWLNMYAVCIPRILLRALPQLPDLSTYPRKDGPPSATLLKGVSHWRLSAECEASAEEWAGLYYWAFWELYPEYARRHHGECHPSHDRLIWIGRNHGRLPPSMWSCRPLELLQAA